MAFTLNEIPGKEISITANGEPVLTYCCGDLVDRSYFHPLYAPNGQVVTADADVSQQHPPGVCFTFGTINDESGEVIQMHRNVLGLDELLSTPTSKPTVGRVTFTIVTAWNAPEPLLIETRMVTVHPLQQDMRILDVSVILHARSQPIVFSDDIGLSYHATEMEHRKTANANGQLGESEVNGQLSEWGTLCGIAADTAIGVAILPHPANGETRFTAADVYDGFLIAHTAPFTLAFKKTRRLAYRLLIYNGDLFTVDVANRYRGYLSTNVTSR